MEHVHLMSSRLCSADAILAIKDTRKRVFVAAPINEPLSLELTWSIDAVTPARKVATVVSWE